LPKVNTPRDMIGVGAQNPILPAVPIPAKKTAPPGQKHKPRSAPHPKLVTNIPRVPQKIPKPQVPDVLKPLGGGTGEPDPQLTPRNSQRGVKQRVGLDVPGVKLR
jgi:hypothetical protein